MNDDIYRVFYIPKTKGYRKIVTYKSLDCDAFRFHAGAKESLERHIRQSKFAKAYIKHRSIITNVRAHIYNDIFLCLDISDFFQSINHRKLISALYYEINKTSQKQFTLEQCTALVKSCSLSNKGLAIGLVPSPILANLYLKEFDTMLYAWLKTQGYPNVIYTRYADDLTISFKNAGDKNRDITEAIIAHIQHLLKDFYLTLNGKKTRIVNLNVSNHVRVTGINIVRDNSNYRKLSVGRKRKDELFYNALDAYKEPCKRQYAQQVKGMQSFILSVEGTQYENSYSVNMKKAISELGFDSLKDLIDAL